jgi:hypothetical protein
MNSNETAHNPLDGITAAIESALHQAREQADTIIADARKEADTIINDAREQAERITADAQADARANGDMERASLAIQEHAAALHTIALGLTGHETTPRDNTGNISGSSGDDSSGSSDTDTSTNTDADETVNADDISASANNANTHSADAIPPAPPVTTHNNIPTANAPTPTSRATVTARPTTRRANGTTRKLAPWEQPEEPQSDTAPEPEETHASDTASTDTKRDATAPQWDAPLIIDAPIQL